MADKINNNGKTPCAVAAVWSYCCGWHLYYTTRGGRFTTVINCEQNTSHTHPHTLSFSLCLIDIPPSLSFINTHTHTHTQHMHTLCYINGKKRALYSHTRTSVLISGKRKHTHAQRRQCSGDKGMTDSCMCVRVWRQNSSWVYLICSVGRTCLSVCVCTRCVCGLSVWGSQRDVCVLTK